MIIFIFVYYFKEEAIFLMFPVLDLKFPEKQTNKEKNPLEIHVK